MSWNLFPFFISGLAAFIVVISELVFGKYALHAALIIRRPLMPFLYGAYYALLAIGLSYFFIEGNLQIHQVQAHQHPTAIGLIVGLSIRAIARLNLYQIKVAEKTLAIGPKMLNDIWEQYFFRKIADDIDEALTEEVLRLQQQLPQLPDSTIDLIIRDSLPSHFSNEKRLHYCKKIEKCPKTFDKLRYFAFHFGLQRLKLIPQFIPNHNALKEP